MTEKRLASLETYFSGSLDAIKSLLESEPDKFGKNSDIAMNIFKDTLNILSHLKTIPNELEKIQQNVEDFDNVFEEISKYHKQ